MTVDWGNLAAQMGAERTVSNTAARQALAAIVGTDVIHSAVDAYLANDRGFELARTVLRTLRTSSATEYCVAQYRAATSPERRRDVVELLRAICGAEGLDYLDELFDDDSEEVVFWAAEMLRELAYLGLDETDQYLAALARAERHPVEGVRRIASEVRSEIQRLDSER